MLDFYFSVVTFIFFQIIKKYELLFKRICSVCFLSEWGFTSHWRIVSFIWECSRYRRRASNFDLHLALRAIEQWDVFSMPHPLCHGSNFYNGQLWGPGTLTSVAERLALELSQPVYTTYVCRDWGSNTQTSAYKENALTDCANTALMWFWTYTILWS